MIYESAYNHIITISYIIKIYESFNSMTHVTMTYECSYPFVFKLFQFIIVLLFNCL